MRGFRCRSCPVPRRSEVFPLVLLVPKVGINMFLVIFHNSPGRVSLVLGSMNPDQLPAAVVVQERSPSSSDPNPNSLGKKRRPDSTERRKSSLHWSSTPQLINNLFGQRILHRRTHHRLDYQPLFRKGARAPRGLEKAVEIRPRPARK